MSTTTIPKTAVIAGATGLVGAALLRLLLDSPRYDRVISFGRRKSGISHPKLSEHLVNFQNLPALNTIDSELSVVDDVFCTLGTTIKTAGSQAAFYEVDCRYPAALAQWAKAHGAQQFLLVSALGADPASRVFYNRTKGEAEGYIKALKLPTTIIARPSLLLGKRSEHRPAEQLSQRLAPLLNPLLQGRFKKYRAIEAGQVASALYQLAQQGLTGVRIVATLVGERGSIQFWDFPPKN